jgi:hypothetical protein
MGDYSWARLEIGGPVKQSVLEKLIHEDDSDLEPDEDSGFIEIESDEERGGTFGDVEDALVKAGIAFDRFCGRHYEWNPTCRRFRPGIGDFEYSTDDDGGDKWLVEVDEIRAALEKGGADRVWELLDTKYPKIPKLEPITWLPEDAEIDAALGA